MKRVRIVLRYSTQLPSRQLSLVHNSATRVHPKSIKHSCLFLLKKVTINDRKKKIGLKFKDGQIRRCTCTKNLNFNLKTTFRLHFKYSYNEFEQQFSKLGFTRLNITKWPRGHCATEDTIPLFNNRWC